MDSHDIAIYCQENDIPFAVVVNTLDDALFANALGANYMICEEDDALMIQPIANEYLFDAKFKLSCQLHTVATQCLFEVLQHHIEYIVNTISRNQIYLQYYLNLVSAILSEHHAEMSYDIKNPLIHLHLKFIRNPHEYSPAVSTPSSSYDK